MNAAELGALQAELMLGRKTQAVTKEILEVNRVLTAAIMIEGANAKRVALPKSHSCAATPAGAATCPACLKRKPPQIAPYTGPKLDPLHQCAGSPDPAVTATCPQCKARKVTRSMPSYMRLADYGWRNVSADSVLHPYSDGPEAFKPTYCLAPSKQAWYNVSMENKLAKKISIEILASSALDTVRKAGYVEFDEPGSAKDIRTFTRAADATQMVCRAVGIVYEAAQLTSAGVELAHWEMQDAGDLEAFSLALIPEEAPIKKAKKAKAVKPATIMDVSKVAAPATIVAEAPQTITIVMPPAAVEPVIAKAAKKAKTVKGSAMVVPTWDAGTLDTSEIGLRKRFTGPESPDKSQPLSWFLAQRMAKHEGLDEADARALALIDLEKDFSNGAISLNMSTHAIASRKVWEDPEKRARISAAIRAGHAAKKKAVLA